MRLKKKFAIEHAYVETINNHWSFLRIFRKISVDKNNILENAKI